MIAARPLAVLVAVASATACGAKHIPDPLPAGYVVIALLPDSDTGKTGRASVWNRSGSADLDDKRDAVAVTARRPPGDADTLSEADVERLFGKALAALPPEPRRFTVYFKFESDELTDQSRALVPSILEAVKHRSDPEVAVVGHTDTLGSPDANIALGMKRASFVRGLLVEAGLDGRTIEVTSHGERALLIRTPDETPEPRNRRVDIAVR
jgi:outer membrane protein OmpA-like peptidoglycan-associated protein